MRIGAEVTQNDSMPPDDFIKAELAHLIAQGILKHAKDDVETRPIPLHDNLGTGYKLELDVYSKETIKQVRRELGTLIILLSDNKDSVHEIALLSKIQALLFSDTL